MWIVRVALTRPYTFIILALLILILSTTVPLFFYIHDRNKRVPEDQMVTFQSVTWAILQKLGIKQKEEEEEQIGPPIRFVGNGIGTLMRRGDELRRIGDELQPDRVVRPLDQIGQIRGKQVRPGQRNTGSRSRISQ